MLYIKIFFSEGRKADLLEKGCYPQNFFQIFDLKDKTCSSIESKNNFFELTFSNEEKHFDINFTSIVYFSKLVGFHGNFIVEFYFNYNENLNQMKFCRKLSVISSENDLIYTFSCKKPKNGRFKAHLIIYLENDNQINKLLLCEIFTN